MKGNPLTLVINPGSTSTKLGVYRGQEELFRETIMYSSEELRWMSVEEELQLRREGVERSLQTHGVSKGELDLIVSRGGLCRPIEGGIYRVNEAMCEDLRAARYGRHPSNLGPIIAREMADEVGAEAIVVDPPTVDELEPVARISGLKEIERRSALHVLNQRAAARRAASRLARAYEDLNLIVAHLGGGITIGAHRRGKIVDGTHGLSEGPFTPERAGSLPTLELLDLALSGRYTPEELRKKLVGEGGLLSYLGTRDALEVERRMARGDEEARLVFEAMAYQISKEIGAMATVLEGEVDGIVITGDLARSEPLVRMIRQRVSFLAPLFVFPGEEELLSLLEAGLRAWRGEEEIKEY